jgi:hypothetical protein
LQGGVTEYHIRRDSLLFRHARAPGAKLVEDILVEVYRS